MSAAYAELEAEVAAQVYDKWTAAMLAMGQPRHTHNTSHRRPRVVRLSALAPV